MAIDAPPHLEPPSEAPVPRSRGRGPIALIVVVGLVLVLIGSVTFVLGGSNDGTTATPDAPTWHGSTVDPSLPRPDFTLTGTDGQPYDFRAETAGKLTFLYFGYTNCPDVCPITMATLTSALSELNRIGAKVVFVTTDPSRDTPARLAQWLSSFPFDVVGLTGTPAQLAAAQKATGVSVAIAEAPDANGNYTVGHSAAMNVYTPDDQQHLRYSAGTIQADWMEDIPKIAAVPAWNEAKGLQVTDAYAGPSNAGTEAVYVSLANGGNDDALVGVSSPDGTDAMLHVTEGTTMKAAAQLDLPGGGELQMSPGGSHIMLSGLTRQVAEGDTVTVVLKFRSAAPLTVTVPVVSFDALAARVPK
jgi:cytochrome oxidase Cu insertion factor (SCO1/SenC/PrrC family)/copper(I)-binding protein